MHCFAHRVVTTERKRHVTHAAAYKRVGQIFLDPPGCLDKGDTIVVVLGYTRRNRKNVRIKNNIFACYTHFLGQQFVGTRTDIKLALDGFCLTLFIEGHNDYGSTIALDQTGLLKKRGFALFHADRIDHSLALNAAQTCLDNRPLGRVNHDGYAGNIRLGSDQVQEALHGRFRIQHAFIHIDIYDLCAVFYLLKSNS